jgi:hypothetical protein|tara:strand:- start:30 stop:425 length:396 start_codon:yes stop_codon:yes gene_type:complete
MTSINPDKIELDKEMAQRNLDQSPVSLLEDIKLKGRVWKDLSKKYGVENPDPPWKITLEATCDVLSEVSCALPGVERRWEEDALSEELYKDVPFPERQLLALVHSMIRRGLIDEKDLDKHMKVVEKRLNMA